MPITPRFCNGCGCPLTDDEDIYCEDCAEDEDGDSEFDEDEDE